MIGVWHFSFTVSDLDRSVEFYTRMLGFELIHTQEQRNEYTSKLVGYPNADLRIAQLAVPGRADAISSHELELVQYRHPHRTALDPERARPGAAHLAIAVPDAFALWDRLVAASCTMLSPEPAQITAGINAGGYAFYFLDPDQITLEGVQPPPSRLQAFGAR